MTATNAMPKGTYARTITLLVLLALLSGCSIYDFKQLVAPLNAALLIRQKGQSKKLSIRPSVDTYTRLNGTTFDPKQIAVTPSDSLAVETQNPSSSIITTSSSVTNAEQAQKTLIRYLALVEEQPERIEKLLNDAEQLAQRYPSDDVLQSLWQRLSRYSDWQPVNSIISSAGIDLVSFNSWQPESPFIRARRALLPPVADNEQIVFGDQRLVMLMVNENAVSLKAQARLEDIPFLPASATTMLYQVDDLPPQQLALADKDDWKTIILTVPAGEHAVRFYQERPVGNQYIKLRFDESGSELAVTQERPYFISTAAQPLEFYSQGPSVLRIDELDQGNSTYRYQQVPEGWHTFRLPPPKGKSRSLLRVSQRVVNLHPKQINNRVVKRTLNPVAEPEAIPQSPVISDKVELIDAYKLGKQEDGTLSAGLSFVRRNNMQESGSSLGEEQFQQDKVNYRYFDELNNAYWNSQGLFRIREYGGPSLGLEESIYYNPDWLPFNVRGNAKLFAQVPDDNLEALGQMSLSLSQAFNLHPKVRLIPNVTFFARALSRSQSGLDQLAGLDPNLPKKKLNSEIIKQLNPRKPLDPKRFNTLREVRSKLPQLDIKTRELALKTIFKLKRSGLSTRDRTFVPKLLSEVTGLSASDPKIIPKAISRLSLTQQISSNDTKLLSKRVSRLTGLSPNDQDLTSRAVSLSNQRAQEVDQDIYTPYKSQHPAGLVASLTLEVRPWLDTVWSTKIGSGTNEDFDITLPDHYSIEEHWLQLLGSVTLDASYRTTFYQADADRSNASKRSFASLEFNWQHWTAHQNRLELATQYTYDIERKAHLAMLSFTWHFGEGRGLRDFALGEIDFRDIRQRQFTDGHNNIMRAVDDCTLPCPAP
jgi:hypothetical protein